MHEQEKVPSANERAPPCAVFCSSANLTLPSSGCVAHSGDVALVTGRTTTFDMRLATQ